VFGAPSSTPADDSSDDDPCLHLDHKGKPHNTRSGLVTPVHPILGYETAFEVMDWR
jgi:hypothetical protein